MLTISFQSSSVELKIENKLSGQAHTMLRTKPNGDRVVCSASKSSIRRFVITEKAPARAFS